jgi:hypothetical protein
LLFLENLLLFLVLNCKPDYSLLLVVDSRNQMQALLDKVLDKLNDIATSIHEVPGHLGDLRYTPEFKASRYKTPSVDEINSIINNSKLSPGQKRKAALDLTTKNHFADFPTANAELQTILDTVQGNPETWANLNKLLKGQ